MKYHFHGRGAEKSGCVADGRVLGIQLEGSAHDPAFYLLCLIFMIRMAWDFNSMNAGEDIAATLGVNVRRLKMISLLLVTLVASISIAFSGVIGFIGLVAPHIARSLTGTDNRRLIPESALMGALVLLVSDTVARTVLLPKEMPVGIITSLIGVPFFLFILTRKKKIWGN